jgi:hypothetical protein
MGCEAMAEVRDKELEGGGVVGTNSVEESKGRWSNASCRLQSKRGNYYTWGFVLVVFSLATFGDE